MGFDQEVENALYTIQVADPEKYVPVYKGYEGPIIIGLPWEGAMQAGSYIGQKFVLNEFVAFSSFLKDISSLSDKTVAVVSFALCGFANLGAMAMLLGGIGGLSPSRRDDLAKNHIGKKWAWLYAWILYKTIT